MVRKNRVPQGATTLRVNHTRNDLPCHVDVDVGGGSTSNIFEIEKLLLNRAGRNGLNNKKFRPIESSAHDDRS